MDTRRLFARLSRTFEFSPAPIFKNLFCLDLQAAAPGPAAVLLRAAELRADLPSYGASRMPASIDARGRNDKPSRVRQCIRRRGQGQTRAVCICRGPVTARRVCSILFSNARKIFRKDAPRRKVRCFESRLRPHSFAQHETNRTRIRESSYKFDGRSDRIEAGRFGFHVCAAGKRPRKRGTPNVAWDRFVKRRRSPGSRRVRGPPG